MKSKRNAKDRGYGLVETAIATPVLLFLMFGLVDLTSVIRAYSSLSEGAETTLRCLYTVDGDCVQAGTDVSDPRYAIDLHDTTTKTLTPKYKYSGIERFLKKPTYQYHNFRARILDDITYSKDTWDYTVQETFYEARGEYQAIVVKSLIPYVTGSHPGNARFYYKGNRSTPYPASVTVSSLGSRFSSRGTLLPKEQRFVTRNRPTKDLGYVEFTMPQVPLPLEYDCYPSMRFNKPNGNHEPNLNSSCDSLRNFHYRAGKTSVVLYLKGNSNQSKIGGEAKVTARLQEVGGGYSKALGGRHYRREASYNDASLVPRGLFNQSFVDSNFHNTDGVIYPEFTLHSPIVLQYGKTYRLYLKLRKMDSKVGKVYYNPTSLSVYGLQLDNFRKTNIVCIGGLLPSQVGDPRNCRTNEPYDLTDAKITSSYTVERVGRVIPLGQFDAPDIGINTALRRSAIPVSPASDYTLLTPVRDTTNHTKKCPKNYGVTDLPNLGSYITNSAQAKAICPTGDTGQIYGIRWSEKDIRLSGAYDASFIRSDCNHSPTPSSLSPGLLKYKKLLSYDTTFTGHDENRYHLGTGIDPYEVVNTSSLYNCTDLEGGFTTEEQIYDEDFVEKNNGNYFDIFHLPLNTCEWEEEVRKKAIENGMSDKAWFKAEREAGELAEIVNNELDCLDYTYAFDTDNSTFLGFTKDGELPAICNEPGKSCSLTLASLSDIEVGSYTQYDLVKAAEQYGYNEVKAGNPRAKFGCKSDHCVNLSAKEEDGTFEVKATARVPLLLLLGNSIDLEVTKQREFEGNYAG